MNNNIKKFGFLLTSMLVALVILAAFMQFSRASAASLSTGSTVALKTTPHAVEADQPGTGAWIITTNIISSSINIVNTATDMVYGPFLEGQLGNPGSQLLDVAVLPDRPIAMLSAFGSSMVSFVDLSNPISPSWIISVSLPMFAEDIDLTPDGRFALVTDGGFSPYVAVIDTINMTFAYTMNLNEVLTPTFGYAQGVEIAPDGTVVVIDYFQGKIFTLLVDETGVLTFAHTYTDYIPLPSEITPTLARPVNIGIAPDGETVLFCHAATDTVSIYRILEPGVLTYTGIVTGLAGEVFSGTSASVQSVAFNEAGDRAYASVNGVFYLTNTVRADDQLAVLNIDGPGMVSLNTAAAAAIPRATGSQLFGVDTIVVVGNKAYLGHPTGSATRGFRDLAVVDLTNFSVYTLTVGAAQYEIPTGIAVLPIHLEMTKHVSAPTATPGSIVTFTIVLDNHGPQVAGLSVLDVLPSGLNFVGPITLDPPGAGTVGTFPSLVQNLTVATHQQVTITFPVSISLDAAPGILLNTALASSSELSTPAQAEKEILVTWYQTYLPITLR